MVPTILIIIGMAVCSTTLLCIGVLMLIMVANAFDSYRYLKILRYLRFNTIVMHVPNGKDCLVGTDAREFIDRLYQWASETNITVVNLSAYKGKVSKLPVTGRIMFIDEDLLWFQCDVLFLSKEDAMLFKLAFG